MGSVRHMTISGGPQVGKTMAAMAYAFTSLQEGGQVAFLCRGELMASFNRARFFKMFPALTASAAKIAFVSPATLLGRVLSWDPTTIIVDYPILFREWDEVKEIAQQSASIGHHVWVVNTQDVLPA